MGHPKFDPAKVPFKASKREATYVLREGDNTIFCGVVSMGNPHCVVEVDEIETDQVTELGPKLEQHDRFPKKANIGFMQIISREHIKLRVWERGAGETLACGSGACAAVVVGILQKKLDKQVKVELPGGELTISWQGDGHPVKMTGPAEHVFDGQIAI